MLDDDYKRLMDFFQQTAEGRPLNLEELCTESLEFFEKLKHQLQSGTPEEKKEALTKMQEMYRKLVADTKKICEKTGLTEEQLVAFAENPNNFSPDQWAMIQNTKNKLVDQGQEMSALVKQRLTSSAGPSASHLPQSKAEKKKGLSKPKKDKWLRS